VDVKTFSEEQLTVDEALRLYTVNAAYGAFEEDVKGSIAPAPEQIKDIKVEMTIVDGNIVYTKK